MLIFGLQIIDIIVIILYFTWIVWIGIRAMRRIETQEDYFLGGRRFGKVIATFSMFGQATSGESGAAAATQVKQMGLAGIMISIFPNFFVLPILFFAAKWYRRLRILTMASFYHLRYKSKTLGSIYAASQALFFILVIGISLMAMAKTLQAMTPLPQEKMNTRQVEEYNRAMRLEALESSDYTNLSESEQKDLEDLRLIKPTKHFSYFNKAEIVIGLAFIVLLYAIGGGLEAAAKTDVIQSIFTLLLTVLLIPVGIMRINDIHGTNGILGAFQSIHRVLPESVFDLLGSPANAEVTWYFLLAFILMVPNSLCQANQLVAAGAAKDDKTAREGFITGLILKRFAAVVWGLCGLIILTIYVGDIGDPDLLWGLASHDLLGSLNLGLVGLMTACMMSALMSMADTHMITVSAMLTENVYQPLVPGRSESHYVLVGRIFAGLYLVGGVAVAMFADDLWTFFKYMMYFNFIFAAPFLMGILWRRANHQAAWAAVIITGTITVLLPLALSFTPLDRYEPLLKQNVSREIAHEYKASEMDIQEREKEILDWQLAKDRGEEVGEKPEPLELHETFTKVFVSRERSIYWDSVEGRKNADGVIEKYGKGLIRVEMLMLGGMGVPLDKLSYPMLETLRICMKFLISFLPFLLVAFFTKPYPDHELDLFYGRLRTPSNADHAFDAEEMAKTEADPKRFDEHKLMPGSTWEFNKWDRYEWIGIFKIFVWVALIYVSLFVLTTIGA